MSSKSNQPTATALFIGDDLALDFINTAYGQGDAHSDCLVSDESVIDWLGQAGVLPPDHPETAPKGLLAAALELRASARLLVEQRQIDKWADPAPVNRILALGERYSELHWTIGGQPRIESRHSGDHPLAVLLPVAEAIARLLAEADVRLLRQCEGDDCTLLFYDHTKSHRRRWCSMAVCGNRMKVAAYRARLKG